MVRSVRDSIFGIILLWFTTVAFADTYDITDEGLQTDGNYLILIQNNNGAPPHEVVCPSRHRQSGLRLPLQAVKAVCRLLIAQGCWLAVFGGVCEDVEDYKV